MADVKINSNRSFGIVFFIVFVLIAIYPLINQELGEPFRRDAMKKPVKVAGINKNDMRLQKNQ